MRRHTLTAALSALVLAASLSACSGSTEESGAPASGNAGASIQPETTAPASTADSSQSTEEGCTALETELEAMAEKYKDIDTSDQAAALEAVGQMMEDMEDVGGTVTNPEVKTAWDGYIGAYASLSESTSAGTSTQSGADEALARLQEASQQMEESMTTLQGLCPKFQEAANQLDGSTSGN